VRFSPSLIHACIVRSHEVAVIHNCNTQQSFNIQSKAARGNSIMGTVWMENESYDLCVITTMGLEFHKFNSRADSMKLSKVSKVGPLHWYQYNHQLRAILFCSGPRRASVQVLQLGSSAIIKTPKFEPQQGDSGASGLRRQDFLVGPLYDRLIVAHIKYSTQELLVFQVGKDCVALLAVQPLFSASESFLMSLIDSIIVVHFLDSKFSLLFDLRFSSEKAVCAPLPIGAPSGDAAFAEDTDVELIIGKWQLVYPNVVLDTHNGRCWQLRLRLDNIAFSMPDRAAALFFLLRRLNADEVILKLLRSTLEEHCTCEDAFRLLSVLNKARMLQESAASSPAKEHKSSRWWFYTPKDSNKGWVVVPDSGAAAVPALASATVRDGGAGGGTIKGSLREGTLLSGADAVDTIGQQAGMFDGIFRGGGYLEIFGVEEAGYRWALIDKELMLNQALLEGSDVRSMVSQQEVLDNVFSPLFLANRVSADRLLPIVIENIRSTAKYNHRVDVALHEFMVRLCLECSPPRYTSLHYLIQYHVIEASRVIARMLLQVDEAYPGATQLALDMLLKVDAHEELIMVLLQRQQVISALKYVRERNIIVSAASFLKAAKATGDDSIFYATYKFFESLNESKVVASQSLHDESCAEYVKHFNATFRVSDK